MILILIERGATGRTAPAEKIINTIPSKNLTNTNLVGAKRSNPDGESAAPKDLPVLPASTTFCVASADVGDTSSKLSPQASTGPRPYNPKPITAKMISGTRAQLGGDNKLLTSLRAQRKVLLEQVEA